MDDTEWLMIRKEGEWIHWKIRSYRLRDKE